MPVSPSICACNYPLRQLVCGSSLLNLSVNGLSLSGLLLGGSSVLGLLLGLVGLKLGSVLGTLDSGLLLGSSLSGGLLSSGLLLGSLGGGLLSGGLLNSGLNGYSGLGLLVRTATKRSERRRSSLLP